MLRDIFINGTILISFIFISSQVFKKTFLNLSLSCKYKFFFGLTQGILGIILMLFTIHSIALLNTLIYFWLGSSIIGILAYYIADYMNTSIKLLNRLKQESTIDFLTGLNNVRQFDNALNESFINVRNKNEHLSILIIDIDFFKKVNDTYGHLAGDSVLQQLGTILSTSCRSFDIVSRIGGEEISVILPDCPSQQALEVAERLRVAVEIHEFILPDETKIKITISIGAATPLDNVKDLDNLINEGDNALYSAKRSGRNKVCQP